MPSSNSQLTIGSNAANFFRQVFGALSNRMQDAEPSSAAKERPDHLRYDIGDLDMRPQSDTRRTDHDLSLLRSL